MTKRERPTDLDLAHESDALKAFEYGMAQEINGWMPEYCDPIFFVTKKIVDGEVVLPLNFESQEVKDLMIKLAQEFYIGTEEDDYYEPIWLTLNAVQLLASGDQGEIEEQLVTYIDEEPEPWCGLGIEDIVSMFLGQHVKAAKALANAAKTLYHSDKELPYPHE